MSYEDVIADFSELALDLFSVLLGHLLLLLGALSLLLDAGDAPPAGPPRAPHVLVGHGQQVALFNRQLHVEGGHALHGGHHF